MAFSYFPHTEDDIRQMLDRIGVGSLEELYSDVPQDVIYRKEYDLPDAMSELEVRQYFEELAEQNTNLFCLCGLGAYDHYSPAVIPHIISRSEYLTAYTLQFLLVVAPWQVGSSYSHTEEGVTG